MFLMGKTPSQKEFEIRWKSLGNFEKDFIDEPSKESAQQLLSCWQDWMSNSQTWGMYEATAQERIERYEKFILYGPNRTKTVRFVEETHGRLFTSFVYRRKRTR